MQIELYRKLSDIDKDSWDHVARTASPFYNYGWFKGHEHGVSDEPIYLVAKKGQKIVGILPGFIVRDPKTYIYHNPRDIILSDEFLDHAITYMKREKSFTAKNLVYRSIRSCRSLLNKMFFPAIIFVSPSGYVGDILIDKDETDHNEIYDALLNKAEDLALSLGIKCVAFPWVTVTNEKLTTFVKDNGFISSYGKPVFEMKIEWQDFDGYINEYLTASRRKFVRKEIKRFEDSKVTIRECGTAEAMSKIDVFARLVQTLLNKYNHKDSYECVLTKLEHLYANMPECTRTFYAEKDNKIIGYLVSFFKNSVHYPKYIGFDDSAATDTYAYFNLIYYNLIKTAIASGDTDKIYYSYASEDAKLKRGCQSWNSFCHYKFFNGRANKLATGFLSHYNDARMKYFETEYSDCVMDIEKSFLR